mgnify:FL=1
MVEVEGEEFVGAVGGADGGVDAGDELEACVDGVGGDGGGCELFEEVEGSVVDVERDVDVFFLVVVARHLTNDSIS